MTKSTLKQFEIKNLFNQYDVSLPLDGEINIFLGENGMGKTTILYCLYYVLSGKVEKLKSITFDNINLSFLDGNTLSISYVDVIAYVDDYLYDTPSQRRSIRIESILSDKEMAEIRDFVLNGSDNIVNLQKYYYKLSDTLGMPLRMAEHELDRFMHLYLTREQKGHKGNYKNVITFKKSIKEKIPEEVLYFPTYRRIEEDLSKLDLEIERNSIKNKLIQFGMSDVETVIAKTLTTITSAAITGFTQMTGVLLKQYLKGNLGLDAHYKIDKEKLGIALDRIGNQIDPEDKEKIKDLVMDDQIYEKSNIYLLNLIKNLIDSYENQNRYDIKVKNFANTCNKYLNDKKYRYDESNVDLTIRRESNQMTPINIQNLSSGEKQIISMFSKLYLEKEEKSIILFDEPELSLSIKWQADFLPDIMKSNKCSMLVAVTHSPFIFDNEFDDLARDMGSCIKDKAMED